MCVCIFTQAKNSGRLLVKMTFFDLKISMMQTQRSVFILSTNLSRSIFMFIYTLVFIFDSVFIMTLVKCRMRVGQDNIKLMKTKWV